jgi:hypothetical protein
MYAYDGPSVLDGAPIVALLTQASANVKTGDVCTLWILAKNEAPHVAQRTGADAAVCGTCPLRPANGGGCYVTTFQGPRSTWRAHRDSGASTGTDEQVATYIGGRTLRLGGYGDPAALPFDVVSRLVASCSNVLGYTHQWRTCDQRFARVCMASVASESEAAEAHALGWRTFRVRTGADRGRTMAREITCPASAEAGKRRTCAECGACDGNGARPGRASIAIDAHGASAKRAAR